MHPVLLSVGTFSLSSFGLLLSLGFFLSVFVIWRLARVYEVNEELIIDLCLLTFFASLIGARLFFVLLNLDKYNSLTKIILLNRYPGLSFWGGIIPGVIVVYLLCRKFKLAFWEVADFVMVGLFGGLIFGSFGCLLSSCQYGLPYTGLFSVPQAGLIGSRFPIQFISAVLFGIGFWYLWKVSLRFHFAGKIASLGLIVLGLIKLLTSFLRGDGIVIFKVISVEQILSLVILGYGIWVYYKQSKRSPRKDLSLVIIFLQSSKRRRLVLLNLKKSWYNLKVNFKFKFKNYLKSINVKHKPPQF